MHWFTIIGLLIWSDFIGARPLRKAQNYSGCVSPFGLENGAVGDDEIDCAPGHNGPGCATICEHVRYNISSIKAYWCGYYDENNFGYFRIRFAQFSIISGFAVESRKHCSHCGITKLEFAYGERSFGFTNFTIFELDEDENYVWFDEAIITKEVSFRPLAYNKTTTAFFYARFELFGCPHWSDASALGMQSGMISDAQLSQGGTVDNYLNPNAARLNTARWEGWKPSKDDMHQNFNERKAWLSIDLGQRTKVIAIDVDKNDDESAYSTTDFFIFYGESTWSKKPYTGIQKSDYVVTNNPMVIRSTYANGEGISKYVFKYPLIAHYIEFYPKCHPCKSFITLELYGESIFKPSHHWSLLGSLEDKQTLQDFLPVEGISLEPDGLVINSTLESQLRTLPFEEDDCLVDADNCGSGLTVQFSAKVLDMPKEHAFRSDSLTLLSELYDDNCVNSDFNFNGKIGLYISEVNNVRGTRLLSATILEVSAFDSISGEDFRLKATLFINKNDDFVKNCDYTISNPEPVPDASGVVVVERNTDTYKIIGIASLLQAVFDLPLWNHGSSLVILLEPYSAEEKQDISLTGKTWQLQKYINFACYDLYYGNAIGLNFSQPGPQCDAAWDASAADFTVNYQWRNCDGSDNYLQVDIKFLAHLSKIKVAGSALNYPETFHIQYSENGTNWLKILNGDGSEFLFRKSGYGTEYLSFPVPIYARYLRVHPVSHGGSYFQLDFDVVLCKTFGHLREVGSYPHIYDLAINHNESTWYIYRSWVHEVKCGNTCRTYRERIEVYQHYLGIHGIAKSPQRISYLYDVRSVAKSSYASRHFKMDKHEKTLYLPLTHGLRWQPHYYLPNRRIFYNFDPRCYQYDFITDSFFVCVGTNKNLYKIALPGGSSIHIGPCCITQVAISTKDNLIYALQEVVGTVVRLPLTDTLLLGEYEDISPLTCTHIKTSKDGVLWCQHQRNILEWISIKKEWSMAMFGAQCLEFEVASTYILCWKTGGSIQRYPRSPEDKATPFKILDTTGQYSTSYGNRLYFQRSTDGSVFGYTLYGNNTLQPTSPLATPHLSYKDVCSRVYSGPSDELYCIEPFGIRFFSNNIDYRRYSGSVDVNDFHAGQDYVLLLNGERNVLRLLPEGGLLVFSGFVAVGQDVVEFEYNESKDILYTLRLDGNIYKQKDSIKTELHLQGPCSSFRMSPNGNTFCSYQGIWFVSILNSWHVIFNEFECVSFHVDNNVVYCHTLNDTNSIFSKVLPIGKDYFMAYPIISSGLQRVRGRSHGTGFQVSLSTTPPTLIISVQTETVLTEAAYPLNMSLANWNDYAFIWSKEDHTVSLYVNQTLVDTKNGVETNSFRAPGTNFLIIGGHYDYTSSYEHNFSMRDIKIWKHNFTHKEYMSMFKEDIGISGNAQATFENNCTTVAVNEDDKKWVCSTLQSGVFTHPIEPSVSVDKWEYHSDKNCSKLKFLTGYLFCLDMNDEFLYIFFNETWSDISSRKVQDFELAYDQVRILVRFPETSTLHLFRLKDFIKRSATNGPFTYASANFQGKIALYSRQKNYVLKYSAQDYNIVNYGISNTGSIVDTISKDCEKPIMYDNMLWCLKSNGYVYKRIGNKWKMEMDQKCNDFDIGENYLLCANGTLYVKWGENPRRDVITFSEELYQQKNSEDYKISKTCSDWPCTYSPLYDAEIHQAAISQKSYYLGSVTREWQNAELLCQGKGGNLASVHSEEDVNSLFAVRHKYISKDVYVGLEKKSWSDGSSYDYDLFTTDSDRNADNCAAFIHDSNPVSWRRANCGKQRQFMCQAYGQVLQKSYPILNVIHWNGTDCLNAPYSDPQRLAMSESFSTSYTVFILENNFVESPLIVNAQFRMYAAENAGGNHAIYLGFLKDNYTDCSSIGGMENIGRFLTSRRTVYWLRSSVTKDKLYLSPDLSPFLRDFINRYRGKVIKPKVIPIVLFWDNNPFSKMMKNMKFEVLFYQKETDNFLEFASRNYQSKVVPNIFTTKAFSSDRKVFTFWYHMYGDWIGKLYVWLINSSNVTQAHLVFMKEGNQGANWRRAIISSPGNGVEWKIRFCAFRTGWYEGNIAIDLIESTTADYGNDTTAYTSDYSFDANNAYMNKMENFGLSMPKLLYSFKNSFQDYAGSNLHLIPHGDFSYQFEDDKFLFPLHSLHAFSSSDNAILKLADMSSISADVKTQFSILFHVKLTVTEVEMTICQFGDEVENNLQVNVQDMNLLLKHAGDTLYTSAWSFTNSTWTYIAITYRDEKISVYVDNKVDSIEPEFKMKNFATFPSSLYFFRDPSKLGSPPTDFFHGSISCFQFYNESMNVRQVLALEFCPDRLESESCPSICYNGGVCIPLLRKCHCPETMRRYYQANQCKNVFTSTLLAEASSYLSLDIENLTDEKGFFSTVDSGESYLAPSPINSGRCIDNTSVVLASSSEKCFLELEGCDDFAISLWLYINQKYEQRGITFFKYGNLAISADFVFDALNPGYILGSMSWQSSASNCSGHFSLPFKSWMHLYITVSMVTTVSNHTNITNIKWKINDENIENGTCIVSTGSVVNTDAILSFGNVSKMCVDEIAIYKNSKEIDLSHYYSVLSNHAEEIDTLVNTVNYYPWVEFEVISNTSYWSEELNNAESDTFANVAYRFETAIQAWATSFWSNEHAAEVQYFQESVDGTVIGYLRYFFKPKLHRLATEKHTGINSLNDYGHFYKFSRTNSTMGVPNLAVEWTLSMYDLTTIQISILNSDTLDLGNHKGYAVVYTAYYVNTTDVFIPEETIFYITGVDTILLNNTKNYRDYHLSVYRLTHQGYGPFANISVIETPKSANQIPPTILEALPYNSTSIKLRWEGYPLFYWSSPNLLGFQVLYIKTSELDDTNQYVHDLSNHTAINTNLSETELIIDGLEVFTEYQISLTTLNDIGIGALSTVTQRSNEGVPELSPIMRSIHLVNTTKVTFNWTFLPDDIDIYNSFLLFGYDITIVPLFPSVTSSLCPFLHARFGNGTSEFTYPKDCEPWIAFNVSIAGYNNIGVGLQSEYCYVLGTSVPGQIQVLNATFGPEFPNEMSSMNISIGHIALENEATVVTHYKVKYFSTTWNDDVTTFNITIHHTVEELAYWNKLKNVFFNCSEIEYPMQSSKVLNYILKLHYYSNYTVTGMACSEEGCSEKNATIHFQTAEHSPFCPPQNISMFNRSSTSLRILFHEMSHFCLAGELQNYGLILIETYKFNEHVGTNYSIEQLLANATYYNETLSRSIDFFDLHEYWNYTIIMFAQTNGGAGVLSDPVYSMTDEDIPDGEPLGCFVTHLNSTSFILTIGKPERLFENGIYHYDVYIISEYGDEIFRRVDIDGEFTETTFFNLTKFTRHNISIRAVTKKGSGPAVTLHNRTLEDEPSLPPSSFDVNILTNDTMTLTWENIPPRSVHGVFQHYHLYGCGMLHNLSRHCFDLNVTEHHHNFTVFPGTHYVFFISGCTRTGCGAITYVSRTTLEMVPNGPIHDISAPNITANTIYLTWVDVNPMKRRGNITHYNVSVTNKPHAWETPEDSVEEFWIANSTNILISGLDNYTLYYINVMAYTAIGSSNIRVYDSYETKQNVPSFAPLNVTVHDTSSSSFNVSWIPIPIENYEGELLGYVIFFEVQEGFTDIRGTAEGTHYCNMSMSYEGRSCEVTGLSLGTPFDVQVAGYTEVGYGLLSVLTNGTTGDFIDGNWTAWTNWGNCERSCGLGKAMRQRWCTNPTPEAGGNHCPGSQKEFRDCNYFPCPGYYLSLPQRSCALTCTTLGTEFGCALDMNFQNTSKHFTGIFDAYNFSKTVDIKCNETLDQKVYGREVDPSYDMSRNICRGYVNIPRRVDCDAVANHSTRRVCRCIDRESTQYTEWALWGFCTKDCGTGEYQRQRECILSDGCNGKSVDKKDCNIDPCPVHGQWGEWSPWSNCSATCGFGFERRQRFCDSPAPLYNGSYCVGDDDIVIRSGCNPMPCPVHGQWGDWSDVSQCKHSCGFSGYRVQKRYCDDPAPLYNGIDCIGNSTKEYPCVGSSECIGAAYIFEVRLTDEVWHFSMYNLINEKAINLTTTVKQEIIKFYNLSEVAEATKNLKIEFISLSKGSVIVRFSIFYEAVPSIEALVLQHSIEGGNLNNMATSLEDLSVDTLPTGPPAEVVAYSPTPFSINVSWSPINQTWLRGAFYLYQVYYRPLDESLPWDNFGTTNTSYELIDLTPGTWYQVRLLAAIGSGNGVASSLFKIQTIEGVPYIKPPSCGHMILDSNSVYFSWDHIPANQVPGRLLGYKISYRKYFETEYNVVVVDKTMDQRTVTTFKGYIWYWVEVAGFTSAGVGPHEVFVFRTPPGAPGVPPPNATVIDKYSTTQMTLSWDFIPKDDENGYLVGYRFYYKRFEQAGIFLVGEEVKDVQVDRYTFSYTVTGLESYTTYEFQLFGYSVNGDGPIVTLYGRTCNCPKYLFNNWYEIKPYTEQIGNVADGIVEGLFPELLALVVNAVCFDCKAYLPKLYYNRTRDGRSSRKKDVYAVKKYLNDDVHMSFPIFGKFAVTRFAGEHPFVGIVASQGSVMLVYQPDYNTVGFVNVLAAVAGAWPVILIAVLMASMMGWIVWFTEQTAAESDITQNKAIYGAYEGFWMSFITMTTLGYGDYVPYRNLSKGVMIIWILTGLCIISIFGGAVSSNMSVTTLAKDYKLYGAQVGAVADSFEHRMAILRNAVVSNSSNYTSVLDVIDAVSRQEVEIGLIDAVASKGYEHRMTEMNVKIYKILDFQSGYGVVLSGEFARVENDVRSFVITNQAEISKFVQKKVGVLQPEILDVEELLFTPEESKSLILNLVLIYVSLSLVCIFVYYGWKICRKMNRVSPEGDPLTLHNEMTQCADLFETFSRNFEEKIEQLDKKHTDERFDLYILKKSYARHLKRAGKPYQIEQKAPTKKRKRRKVIVDS